MKYELEIDEDNEWDEGGAAVVRVDPDGSKVEVGWIGSEPEDNTYYRAYSWIVGALNEAYQLGFQTGRESCIEFPV